MYYDMAKSILRLNLLYGQVHLRLSIYVAKRAPWLNVLGRTQALTRSDMTAQRPFYPEAGPATEDKDSPQFKCNYLSKRIII